MSDFVRSMLITSLKTQILFSPLIIFYLICFIKKLSPSFRWIVHRGATVMFLGLPVLFILMHFSLSFVTDRLEIAPEIDINREWTPEFQESPEQNESTSAPIENFTADVIDNEVEQNGIEPIIKYSIPKQIEPKRRIYPYGIKLLNLLPFIPCFLILLLFITVLIQSVEERKIIKTSSRRVYRNYPVYYSKKVHSPFSTGFFSKKIFVPYSYLNKKKTMSILIHELAHIEGNHNLWTLLESLVICLNWYNPLWYLYKNCGELLKELLADQSVTNKKDVIEYSRLIIEELESLKNHNHQYLATGFIKKRIIKERISNMMNPITQKATKAIKIAGLAAIFIPLVLTVLIGCSEAKEIIDPNDFSYVKISELSVINESFNLVLGENGENKDSFNDSIIYSTPEDEIVLALRDDKSIRFSYYNQSGEISNQISIEANRDDIFSFAVDHLGDLFVFIYDSERNSGRLIKYLDDDSIEEIMSLKDVQIWPGIKIEVDGSGTLYVKNEDMLEVYKNGKRVMKIGEVPIRSMTISPDGALYYISWDNLKQINIMNSETSEIRQFETAYENSVISFHDDRLLIMDTKGIKEYDDSSFKGYIANSEDYPELMTLFSTDFIKIDNSIYITSWNSNSGELFLHQLKITDKERDADNRPSMTIRMPPYLHSSMEYAAKKYNQTSANVKIVVSQYENNNENWEAYTQKLSTEILAGNGPDIIYLSYLPYKEYMAKGVLENLNPYLEDDSFNRDDYLPALTAAETDRGLYGLATDIWDDDITFSVKESVMKKYGYSGSYIDIPWEELLEIAKKERRTDSNGMEIYPFGIPEFDEHSMFFLGKILIMNNYFLNRESEEFDEYGFKSYLEIIDTIKNGDIVKSGISGAVGMYNSMEEGSTVFLSNRIQEFWTDLIHKKHIFNDEPVMIVHPILANNDLHFRTTLLGINSHSEYKDEAWDFLKTVFTKEYQEKMFIHSTPVHKELLKERTIASLKNSEQFHCSFSDDSGTMRYDGLAKYTEEDINNYYRINEKFRHIPYRIRALDKIVFEQLDPFLEGTISRDETASMVKERVNTYINE
ncbi:extracellular solute-binding protein [Oceanispirochaeta sp. M1]|nr:extracellular solute-binding protein [Oceanispirochaeta sp. M1]